MNSSFSGKVVLITGGTSGIGRATAVAFAEQGANVVAGRREAEGAESVRLVEKTGGKGLFVRTDVAIEKEVEAMVARTVEYFGRLDFAFNNAGVGEGLRAGIANTNEVFNRVMDTNVRGVFFSLKHEIPAILQSGGGAIVNNASVAGLRAFITGIPIYTASKFAVVGLTRSVALEFAAKGVRVNAVCPATIETEMTERLRQNNELRAKFIAMHPIGRFGQLEEVAAAVLYLCSPGAAFITGVALPVDGGALA
jgi:NAD(P)-dependent dehydrogenase (short-subunit alcohol dehydrogenase family)